MKKISKKLKLNKTTVVGFNGTANRVDDIMVTNVCSVHLCIATEKLTSCFCTWENCANNEWDDDKPTNLDDYCWFDNTFNECDGIHDGKPDWCGFYHETIYDNPKDQWDHEGPTMFDPPWPYGEPPKIIKDHKWES